MEKEYFDTVDKKVKKGTFVKLLPNETLNVSDEFICAESSDYRKPIVNSKGVFILLTVRIVDLANYPNHTVYYIKGSNKNGITENSRIWKKQNK